jgi:hypothetical protein
LPACLFCDSRSWLYRDIYIYIQRKVVFCGGRSGACLSLYMSHPIKATQPTGLRFGRPSLGWQRMVVVVVSAQHLLGHLQYLDSKRFCCAPHLSHVTEAGVGSHCQHVCARHTFDPVFGDDSNHFWATVVCMVLSISFYTADRLILVRPDCCCTTYICIRTELRLKEFSTCRLAGWLTGALYVCWLELRTMPAHRSVVATGQTYRGGLHALWRMVGGWRITA